MVEIKNVTKYYGSKAAVKDLSFNLNDNEILGFLGPNGAGKSTTMNIICGCLPSTFGTVTIEGHDISEEPLAAKKCIGYLPEIPPVYPDMKVMEYMKFCAGLKGIPKAERKEQINIAMDRLKITDISGRLIKNLSKGYKQRVGFAQALLGNPQVLVLDEPTVGLDPSQVAEVRKLIKELRADHSVILSSHILSEIQMVCDRVVIINKGIIQAEDTIENLEKSMTKTLSLELTVDGPLREVQRTIAEVPGVNRVRDSEFVSTGVYKYRVDIKDETVRNKVLSALLNIDANVISVEQVKLDLEQVFLKLINKPADKKRSLEELLHDTEEEDIDGIKSNNNSDDKKEETK